MDLSVFGRSLCIDSIQLSSRGDALCTSNGVDRVLNGKVLKSQASQLYEWLLHRCGTKLSSADLRRLGFLENEETNVENSTNETRYEIKRIAFASGKEQGWRAGRYYASDRKKGGVSTFWEILFYTIQTHIIPVEGEPGSPIASDVEEAEEAGPGVPSVALTFSAAPQAQFIDRLDKWCQNNPGKFFKLSCPGFRGPSTNISGHRVENKSVFCYSPHGECIRSSVANALGALAGPRVSLLMLRKGPIVSKNLGQAGSWLERHMKRYRLQKITIPVDQETAGWVMQQTKGIYIATLCGYDDRSETIEYTLVIDAEHKLVYDSMEKVPSLRMEKGVLDCCVGDSFTLLGVSEVKMITTQKMGSGKNKNRKIPAEVQRRRKKGKTGEKVFVKKRKAHKTRKIIDDDE